MNELMKAIIKLDLSYPNRLFNTKEEWDSYKGSLLKQDHLTVSDDPNRFPCVSIATHYEYSDSFLTLRHHYFFYVFTLEN